MACSAKCSMSSMKCTDSVFAALAGAGTMRNVYCSVCRVLPAKYEDLAVKTGRIALKIYPKKHLLKKHVALVYFIKTV